MEKELNYNDYRLSNKGFKSWFANWRFYKLTRSIFFSAIGITMLSVVNLLIDEIIVGNISKEAIKGVGFISLIIMMITSFVAGFHYALSNNVGPNLNVKKYEDAQKGYNLSLFLRYISITVLFVIFIIWRNEILGIALTQNEVDIAMPYFWWILGAYYIYAFSSSLTWIFSAVGEEKIMLVFMLVNMAINISISLIAVYALDMGVFGTGMGTFISFLVTCIVKYIWAHKYFKGLRVGVLNLFNIKVSYFKMLNGRMMIIGVELFISITSYLSGLLFMKGVDEGVAIWAVISPFYAFLGGATGVSGIMSKYVGTEIGHKNKEGAKAFAKIVLTTTLVRTIPFVLLNCIVGVVIPYAHIYKLDHDTLIHIRNCIIFSSFVTISSIVLTLAFMSVILEGKSTLYSTFELIELAIFPITTLVVTQFTSSPEYVMLSSLIWSFTGSTLLYLLSYRLRYHGIDDSVEPAIA